MSRIHICFVKQENNNNLIRYSVESHDFGANAVIGEILIEPDTGKYQFIPKGIFDGKLIIPPEIFNLPENEQKRRIESDYLNFEYAGYSSRIAKMVNRILEKSEYPDKFYGVT
ncbi:MAG: hypothetical protein OEX19_11790 [Gammaproteobacteria bacterium]|nr:hypothetical protein [Gammaproteobacteria bacterium]